MRRTIFAILLTIFVMGAVPFSASAAPSSPLCLPSTFAPAASDCLPYGPSAYISDLQDLGIIFPLRTMPASQPDLDLAYLPYSYARVRNQPSPVYASIEEAIENKIVKRYIEPGFDYVSYIDVREFEGKKYYMIAPGEWMSGRDLSAGVAYAQFMGLEFSSTPSRDFGWILEPIQISAAAGVEPTATAVWLDRWDVIQVYDTQEINGLTWYLIGPDQWVESRKAALVYPMTEAPNGVDNGRWVEINLFQQTMAVYENNQMVFATLTSTGLPGYWTRPGLFHIREKLVTTPMSGSFEADRSDYYYLEDVPWTMYFDEARAFHGTYWHNRFGSVRSKGCANLSSGDSQWLFNWAEVGDWVYVWDPSGETPTDPSLYSAGGA